MSPILRDETRGLLDDVKEDSDPPPRRGPLRRDDAASSQQERRILMSSDCHKDGQLLLSRKPKPSGANIEETLAHEPRRRPPRGWWRAARAKWRRCLLRVGGAGSPHYQDIRNPHAIEVPLIRVGFLRENLKNLIQYSTDRRKNDQTGRSTIYHQDLMELEKDGNSSTLGEYLATKESTSDQYNVFVIPNKMECKASLGKVSYVLRCCWLSN